MLFGLTLLVHGPYWKHSLHDPFLVVLEHENLSGIQVPSVVAMSFCVVDDADGRSVYFVPLGKNPTEGKSPPGLLPTLLRQLSDRSKCNELH